MPVRTNAFQEMVALLTAVMREDESMKVTPSAMLTDVVTGEAREVDIAVETEVAGHAVIVGIECRDWKRPQGVQWIEEMHAKHFALPVHLTVLISSSGFTKSAIKKAKHYSMRTITPGEVTPGFVGTVVNNLSNVVTKRAAFGVKTVRVRVESPDGERTWVKAFADSPVYTSDGTEIADIGVIVRGIVDGNPAQRAHLKTATDKDKFMNIQTDPPRSHDGRPLCVKLLRDGEELSLTPIEAMHIQGPVKLDLVDVPLKHGDFDGTPYSSGSTPFEELRVVVVATESVDGTVKWAGSVTKPDGEQDYF